MQTKVIRVHRKDSAFVYAILESLDGMASFTTLDDEIPGQSYRDIRLCISDGYSSEIQAVLESFRKKFPVLEVNHVEVAQPR